MTRHILEFDCPECGAKSDPGRVLRNGGHQGECVNGHKMQVCQVHNRVAPGRTENNRALFRHLHPEVCVCPAEGGGWGGYDKSEEL